MADFQPYLTKQTPVRALQYDGDIGALFDAVREAGGRTEFIKDVPAGFWVVLDGDGGVTSLPPSVFERCYVTSGPVPKAKSCFDCEHYVSAGGGRCLLFEEPIDSELVAASNCADYYSELQP